MKDQVKKTVTMKEMLSKFTEFLVRAGIYFFD